MKALIVALLGWLLGRKGAVPETQPSPVPAEPISMPMPEPTLPPAPAPLLWDTPENARHSIRVICDEELPIERTVLVDGLYYLPKDVITACIRQESRFRNLRADGTPTRLENLDKAGRVWSTDWGICQVNDYWHIKGHGKPEWDVRKEWESVEEVVANPEKVVRWMIRMYKAGQLGQWVSYSSGAYVRYLPR
jgi:hypothetical protein